MNKTLALCVLAVGMLAASARDVILGWDPPPSYSSHTGYRMEQRIGTNAWTTIGRFGKTNATFSVTNVLVETNYTWRLFTTNATAESVPSNEVNYQVPPGAGGLRVLSVVLTVELEGAR